jgi:hypothetical protein
VEQRGDLPLDLAPRPLNLRGIDHKLQRNPNDARVIPSRAETNRLAPHLAFLPRMGVAGSS